MQGSESTPENVEVNPVEQRGGRLGAVLSVIVVCAVDLRVLVSVEYCVVSDSFEMSFVLAPLVDVNMDDVAVFEVV